MNTDRSTIGSISNDQNTEWGIIYTRALAKARLSMTSEQAQAQITNLDALVSAICKINLPLTVASKSIDVDYNGLYEHSSKSCVDFSSVPSLPESISGYACREVSALKMFHSPNVAEIVSQLRSVGLEPGTRREFFACLYFVVRSGLLDAFNFLTVISVTDTSRVALIRKAGEPKAECFSCSDSDVFCDMDKTLVVGVKDTR
jgi:hypothetical protein